MATLGEEEPLDGECGAYDSYGEDEDDDNASTADGGSGSENENEKVTTSAAAAAVPFPAPEVRESLGFLHANRKMALPGVGFDGGGSDDGRMAALAALDRFGLLLVSSATGVCVCVFRGREER